MTPALDMQRERAQALARAIVARAPAGSIGSIFAGGSLGRGEVWAASFDNVLEVYSDIDLYVVAAQESAAMELRRVTQSLPAPAAPAGVRFLRPADIGVYTRADLAAQPLRPGTAELDTQHLLLHGDAAIARSLRGRGAGEIPAEEALYLLENRVTELSTAVPENGSQARLSLAQALKARLDIYSAHAIADGSFAATMAERARRFALQAPPTLAGGARDEVAAAFSALASLEAWMRTRVAEEERRRVLSALADAWRLLAPRVLHADAAPAGLVAMRCREGDLVANAREVVRIRRATRVSLWRAAVGAVRFARLAPVAALRVDALARVLAGEPGGENAFHGHFAYVDRLTRHFGFTGGGTRDECVRRMYTALS